MSRLPAAHLNHAHLRRLLQAVGSSTAAEADAIEATKHNWRSPHYFTEEQYNRLAAVMSQVAAVIAAGLGRYFNRELTVSPASISQHFAGSAQDLGIAQSRYSLTFGGDVNCGFLSVTAETALRWVTQLLGDTGSAAANRALSSLEESLLIDLVTAVADAFLSPLRAHRQLQPGDRLLQDDPALPLEPAQEVCRIIFSITGSQPEERKDEVLFLLPCSLLAPLVGKGTQALQQISPEELSRTLQEHVQQMPVTVTARLTHTTLDFGELLGLETEDILLLDKPLDESVELLVEDRVVFRGHVARSAARRAVVVTQSMLHPMQKATKTTGK
jgi:flagellar motor switch protein FliM